RQSCSAQPTGGDAAFPRSRRRWRSERDDPFGARSQIRLRGHTDEPGAKQWALKAQEAFRQRPEGDDIAAMIGLAAMYQSGTEIEPDVKQAVTLYQKAAGRGSSEAMLLLAALSFSGEGVEKDKTQGVRWMTQAAERG